LKYGDTYLDITAGESGGAFLATIIGKYELTNIDIILGIYGGLYLAFIIESTGGLY
jgi:hypothetical protein